MNLLVSLLPRLNISDIDIIYRLDISYERYGMSIGIILVTHPGVGRAILQTARDIIGHTQLTIRCVEVPIDSISETIQQQLDTCITQFSACTGVLILTDLYAATPHNMASHRVTDNTLVLAGLNLPMLLRVLNYADETSLSVLYEKAKLGGIRGIY